MSLLAHFCDFKNLTFCCRSGKFLLVQFPKKSASLVAHVRKILFSKNDIETLKKCHTICNHKNTGTFLLLQTPKKKILTKNFRLNKIKAPKMSKIHMFG